MSKSKRSCGEWVTGVGIELSQTLVWTAKKEKKSLAAQQKYYSASAEVISLPAQSRTSSCLASSCQCQGVFPPFLTPKLSSLFWHQNFPSLHNSHQNFQVWSYGQRPGWNVTMWSNWMQASPGHPTFARVPTSRYIQPPLFKATDKERLTWLVDKSVQCF